MKTTPLSWICAICENILCPPAHVDRLGDGPGGFHTEAAAQTNEVYLEAVRSGCCLCSLIHHLSGHQRPDGKRVGLSTPLKFFRNPLEKEGQPPMSDRPNLLCVVTSPSPQDGIDHGLRSEHEDERIYIEFVEAPLDCVHVPAANLSLSLSTGSQLTLDTARGWLETCSSNHEMCSRRRSTDGWRPTRLLDLSDPRSSTWKLCLAQDNGVADGTPCQHMTLSYRWARHPTLMLTKNTLATFQQGLPIIDLPLLFRQVIDVVRHFGIRYLWIDALCIVQDWTEDWEREAAMMHKVYTNSVCNIAALTADGPHESLFRDTDRKQIAAGLVETTLFSREDSRKTYAISEFSYYKRQFWGPLSNRGWVMQEKLLAPRVLYFGQHQVLWECLAEKKTEVFPRLQPGRSHVKNITALWDFIGPRPAPGTAAMSDELLAAWTRVLEEYVGCQLTYATDKLFAIAGIAHVFAEVSGDVFTAGMWKNRMADQLDWHVKRSLSRPAKFVAPSFSWASVDNAIFNFPKPSYKALVEVLEVTTPADGQPCFLKVRGRMFAISENPHHQPDDPPYLLNALPRSKSGSDPGLAGPSLSMWPVDWDATDDMPPIGSVSVVISSYFDPGDWIVLGAIVLVKSSLNGVQQEYRRVGSVAVDCDGNQFEQLLTIESTEFTWV